MADNMSQDGQNLFDYISKNAHIDSSKIKPKTMLFKEGILDSMAFVLLIDFLEEKFNIKVKDNDLIEENFESIDAISKFIEKKKAAA